MKPHKHAELIKAWADGEIIQFHSHDDKWFDTANNFPAWEEDQKYRIKPKPDKSNFEMFYFYKKGELLSCTMENEKPNLKLIFTGEGKLKDAKVLK